MFKLHSQNLNERKGRPNGHAFWHGRAWLKWCDYAGDRFKEICHAEWLFGKFARHWALKANFGYGEDERDICLHACIPFVFSIYFVFPAWRQKFETELGISSHNGCLWISLLKNVNEWSSDMPWYRKGWSFNYPWTLRHHCTELLRPLLGVGQQDWPVVFREDRKTSIASKKLGKRGAATFTFEEKQEAAKQLQQSHTYTYRRKNGQMQITTATIHVERMEWRARWYPVIPIRKVRTSIDVRFDKEVGEGVDHWKGGCVGCGYDMLPDEMPVDTLRRMERERKFER